MENKSNSHGRTIPDLISENPKKALHLFIGIIIIFLVFLFMGNSLKVGSVELNGKEKIIHDTIIKVIRDTIIIEKPTNVTKYTKPTKKTSDIEVNDEKTEIKASNQPSNINTGTNNGILGNNNTINNLNEKPIILIEEDKKNILLLVNDAFNEIPDKTKKEIKVLAMLGNARSIQLADLIIDFLKKEGYVVIDSGQGMWSKTKKGVEIYPRNGAVNIDIGII
ncbi:hypothetical protein [Mariniflexile sp. AS56]|uniref:hypothetical protein n=1 Tax=Flavobacteriaceae TaxID=49546 RepID=UPI0026EBC132|nr:hypothetical protein [Mariniflexile sp. AS56]MDO7174194.1 hypothetical protein [Mariniflexile sp. AS56]